MVHCVGPTTPLQLPGTVWAGPRSLAATYGVSLISFPAGTEMVQFPALALLSEYRPMTVGGFPHSDIPGSSRACPLPEAFRRLLRPSSPPAAKASTMCPL